MNTFLFLSVLFLTNFSLAEDWPTDPVCLHHGGRSETFTLPSGEQRVLCLFGFESYVDTDSVWNSEVGIQSSAVLFYSQNESFPVGHNCSFAGARVVKGLASTGRKYELCVFYDDSIMEAQTFENGPGSYFNRELDLALGLDPRF